MVGLSKHVYMTHPDAASIVQIVVKTIKECKYTIVESTEIVYEIGLH
jgi:hypothetical protein